MSQLTVILVHSNRLFSEGLLKIFENSRYRVTYAGGTYRPAEVDTPTGGHNPVFIVGGHDAAQQVKALRGRHRRSIIILVGESGPDEDISPYAAAGATCYLRETINGNLLLKTLDILTQNEVVLCTDLGSEQPTFRSEQPAFRDRPEALPQASEVPASDIAINGKLCASNGSAPYAAEGKISAPPGLQLSTQEAVILRDLVEGLPNKVIANRLQITEATVKVHVKAILRKVRAKNRTQAAIWALRHLS